MAHVLCDEIAPGLRASEAIAVIRDVYNRRHFIRAERDFLHSENGRKYLPVAVVHQDPKTQAILVELPHEAETGTNRLWISKDKVLDSVGIPA